MDPMSTRTVRFTHATARLVRPAAPTAPSIGTARPPSLAPAPAPLQPVPVRTAPPAPASPPAPAVHKDGLVLRMLDWMTGHRLLTLAIASLVMTAGIAAAAVVFGQSFTATPTTRTSPVAFGNGDDVTSLDTLDFIDAPTISASGASASITLYGIPGASSLALGEVLELVNADTADNTNYAVTLSVSGTPAATLTAFTITFSDDVSGTPTTRTWNLLTTPTLTTYTLSDAETWELNVSSLVMTSAASGSQGTLTITASMTPV